MNKPSVDHQRFIQEAFRGIFSRGGTGDIVPAGYFQNSRNVKFTEGEVLTRDGSEITLTTPGIVRMREYKRLNETPRFIWLDSTGSLWDSLYTAAPIWSDPAFVDFSGVNYGNRYFITPHDRKSGLADKFVLIYDGNGLARLAGGLPPSGFTMTAANSAASGSVEIGYHRFAVAFVTNTGYITAPGPAVLPTVLAPGGFKVTLSGIGLGGSEVVARVLLATKSRTESTFNNNPFQDEFFFIPNGVINDNTTTTVDVDFYDTDLGVSGDYLYDSLAKIPAGLSIFMYNGRLGIAHANGGEFTIRFSKTGAPETFDDTNGFYAIDPSSATSGITNCFEHRKILVIATSNRLYSTADNGSDPNTWGPATEVDKSVGTEVFGVATILDARGTNNDRAWIADRSGLICFEGYVKRPELSWNISDLWSRINKAHFNLVEVVDDPEDHMLYISCPVDGVAFNNCIIVGDYSNAHTVYGTINEKVIQWDVWTFPSHPVSIIGSTDAVTKIPVLFVAVAEGLIIAVKDGLLNDYGTAIDAFIQTDLKYKVSGWVNHFGYLKFRIRGAGILQIVLYGEDDDNPTSIPTLNLLPTPGYEPETLINYSNEKMAIKLRVSDYNEWFAVSRIDTWIRELWMRRAS